MPRKVRGRPVAYGAAQLRALEKFMRDEYLMHLSGDPLALLEGEPFHEDGRAYFDPDDFHMAILDKTGFSVSPWQTSNALTKIGVRSVRRRFENGVQRRVKEVPIPKGARCELSPQDTADYWTDRGSGWVGSWVGEEYLTFKREYERHGLCDAVTQFVRGVFADYPENKGARLLEALMSHDADSVVVEYEKALEVSPHADGYRVQYRMQTPSGADVLHDWFAWSEHAIEDAMQ